jgi:hypothetical protein
MVVEKSIVSGKRDKRYTKAEKGNKAQYDTPTR